MSYKLFRQCLSPASADPPEVVAEPEAGAADVPEAEGTDRSCSSSSSSSSTDAQKHRRSRSALSAFLSLFRSAEQSTTKAPNSQHPQQEQQQQQQQTLPSSSLAQGPPVAASADAGTAKRRKQRRPRRPGGPGAGGGSNSSNNNNSSLKLKRDRCPKCHGVLPVASTPELPPVLVRPGQARCKREYKEDSGCIMTERSARPPSSDRRSARPAAAAAVAAAAGFQEDSGNYSGGSSTGNHQGVAELPHLMPNFYARRTEYSTCVPRIPNREAPMNFVSIRG